MTSYDKLSVIIPISNVFLNDNLKILSLYTNNILCILIKDNDLQCDIDNISIKFDLEEIELDTNTKEVGYIIYPVLKHIKSKVILFLDKYTLINYSHFEYFLKTSLALSKGFITGITLTKEGENWRTYHPVSHPSNQWENFENYALSTSLTGGVIYHTDLIKKYFDDYYYPNNIFNDILFYWYLYSHRTGPCFPKVISLEAEKKTVLQLYDYDNTKILADLELILKQINFNNEMLIGFYDFITNIISKNIEPQKQLLLRINLFLLIKLLLK